MIMPFLSLYIETFGDNIGCLCPKMVRPHLWGNMATAFIMSPVWGRVADKYGFKRILLVNGFGIATSVFLMGFVNSVETFSYCVY